MQSRMTKHVITHSLTADFTKALMKVKVSVRSGWEEPAVERREESVIIYQRV
jgi:hypothetical protein